MEQDRPVSGAFKLPQRTALLKFTDEPYAGLEVRVRLNVSLRTWAEMGSLMEGDTVGSKQVVELCDRFAEEALLSWNYVGDDGEPVPATAEGLKELPPAMSGAIIMQWQEAVSTPPVPLSSGSRNGVIRAGPIPDMGSLEDFSEQSSLTGSPNDTPVPQQTS